jgi:hypothetical protein
MQADDINCLVQIMVKFIIYVYFIDFSKPPPQMWIFVVSLLRVKLCLFLLKNYTINVACLGTR